MEPARRIHGDAAAGETLADVVVGVALEGEGHALRHEGAEALASGAGELDADGILGEAGGAVLAGDLAAGDGADDAVDVADRQLGRDLLALLEGGLAEGEELGDDRGICRCRGPASRCRKRPTSGPASGG